MTELVFLLEEPSAQEMLKGLLPKILPENVTFRTIPFEGKTDLEKRLEVKLRGYLNPEAKFIILRDKDAGDCHIIKQRLLKKCQNSGRHDFLVRIACHELESWYLADLLAVERGMNKSGLAKKQNKAKYRYPDTLANAAQELERLVPEYQKVSGSRQIAPYLDPVNTRSHSFMVFVQGVKKLSNTK
ncbi:MAG TPA: DUF4276 family protein [bacterium]|nr:DUF4276 family protein [bacterium]HPN42706.1 DUF4276 family protein [bacterium]